MTYDGHAPELTQITLYFLVKILARSKIDKDDVITVNVEGITDPDCDIPIDPVPAIVPMQVLFQGGTGIRIFDNKIHLLVKAVHKGFGPFFKFFKITFQLPG
jgi:hypothetical protein